MSYGSCCAGLIACNGTLESRPHPPQELGVPAAPAKPVAAAEPIGSAEPPSLEASVAASRQGRCRTVGPMVCSAAPSSHAGLCNGAAECVSSFTRDKNYVAGMSLECDVRSRTDIESAYSKQAPAPPDSGLKGTALVTWVAVQDGYRDVFGASYLVADFVDGSCLVDVVHDWDRHSASAETTFHTEWKSGPNGWQLQVESRRILRESLDQAELAAGESDVRSDYCERITYDVVDGRFERKAGSSSQGSCGK
jgi:hypothetical protein